MTRVYYFYERKRNTTRIAFVGLKAFLYHYNQNKTQESDASNDVIQQAIDHHWAINSLNVDKISFVYKRVLVEKLFMFLLRESNELKDNFSSFSIVLY